ncbi:MAG: type IX secretion system outer membrane channel protein PorV [Prevotellaceae bacterium]|jgi:hypothetical protein|nr:type IX secretion system outer membrane channel protein PorV [Prevotellaceae bacterium]
MATLRKSAVLSLVLVLCACCQLAAQERYRPEVLFILDIAPDARASGMGDVGVATTPDVTSQKWNASKYIFANMRHGVSVSYTPWMNKISRGLNMGLISGYTKFAGRSAIGFSATYLSIGGIDLYSREGLSQGTISSNEYSLDISYSHRLGDYVSGGISLRYASAIKVESFGIPNSAVLRPSPAFAGDVSFFYTRPVEMFNKENHLSAGICVSNLGTKVKLSGDDEMLMPMNLRMGVTYDWILDTKNSLTSSIDINKSLVPSGSYSSDITVFEAIGKSFEKARDFIASLGFEYSYTKLAMVRAGYHHSRNSPSFRYFTLGGGLIYKSIHLDASYLISTSSLNTALANTFRLTLGYVW